MKLPLLICLVNLLLAVFFSMLIESQFTPAYHNFFSNPFEFMQWVCPVGGAVDLVVAIFLYGFRKNLYGHGFLLSAAILLSIGYFTNR